MHFVVSSYSVTPLFGCEHLHFGVSSYGATPLCGCENLHFGDSSYSATPLCGCEHLNFDDSDSETIRDVHPGHAEYKSYKCRNTHKSVDSDNVKGLYFPDLVADKRLLYYFAEVLGVACKLQP